MWPSTTKVATPTSSQDDRRRPFIVVRLVSGRRHVKRAGRRSEPSELTRLDQVHEHVPLVFLQGRGIRVLADADRVAVNDDFRTGGAPRTERDPFHWLSPPLASIFGQIAAWRPFVPHELRMVRTPASRPSRSAAFCSSSARRCAHGADPERRSTTICFISASVRPSRRAWPTKVSSFSTSGG